MRQWGNGTGNEAVGICSIASLPHSPIASLASLLVVGCSTPPGDLQIALAEAPSGAIVRVTGLSSSELASLRSRSASDESWPALLRVSVTGGETPVLGQVRHRRYGVGVSSAVPVRQGAVVRRPVRSGADAGPSRCAGHHHHRRAAGRVVHAVHRRDRAFADRRQLAGESAALLRAFLRADVARQRVGIRPARRRCRARCAGSAPRG